MMLYYFKGYKGVMMKKLIIKIGKDMKEDLKEVFNNPKSAKVNTHTLYLKDSKDLYEILSPQRIDLLKFITNNTEKKYTISELAKQLKRRQEAISRDTILLSKYRIIEKVKEKQKVHIKAIYDTLDLKLVA
jgi:predicted transcriptional regulator